MKDEQLAVHRELEYLRAVGRTIGPRRRRRQKSNAARASDRRRIVERRRKLGEVPRDAA